MSVYETIEVPFETWGNRQVLTERKLAEMPALLDLVHRFPACFERDFANAAFIFYPEGNAPGGGIEL